jgi:hypothetical protein
MVLADDFYKPSAGEVMSQTRDFKQWCETNGFSYSGNLTSWKDCVFLIQEDTGVKVFARVDADEWELLGNEEFAEKSEALKWYRGVMTGSRNPLDLL